MPGCHVHSCLRDGAKASVRVNVDMGLPGFTIVGAPDATCRAVRDRVRAALTHLGWEWPLRRITVSVVPGPGAGISIWPGLDLPIALGILAATDQLELPAGVHAATLGLDGSTQPPTDALGRNPAMPDDTLEDADLDPATQAYFADTPPPLALWERLRFVGYEPEPDTTEAVLQNVWGLLRQLSGVLSDLVDDRAATLPSDSALREADRAVHAAVPTLRLAVIEAQEGAL